MDSPQILVGHESYRSNGFRERPSGKDKRQRRVPDEYELLKEDRIYIKKSREKIHEWGFFLLFYDSKRGLYRIFIR